MELENITVTDISAELKTKTGAPFWAIALSDGRKATIWDAMIADAVRANINVPSQGFVKGQGSFLNLREFQGGNTAMTSANPGLVEALNDAGNVFAKDQPTAPSVDEFNEADALSVNAKSSVKIKKMAKGIQWDVKVVTGEESLVPGLVAAAISGYKAIGEQFPVFE